IEVNRLYPAFHNQSSRFNPWRFFVASGSNLQAIKERFRLALFGGLWEWGTPCFFLSRAAACQKPKSTKQGFFGLWLGVDDGAPETSRMVVWLCPLLPCH